MELRKQLPRRSTPAVSANRLNMKYVQGICIFKKNILWTNCISQFILIDVLCLFMNEYAINILAVLHIVLKVLSVRLNKCSNNGGSMMDSYLAKTLFYRAKYYFIAYKW